MRYLLPVSMLAVLVAAPAASAPAPKESWGKAGITLAQYRQDALDCGLRGYYTDISKTDDAKAFVNASRQLDTLTNGGSTPVDATDPAAAMDQAVQYANQQQQVVDGVHADQRVRSIKQLLVLNDNQCLIRRGYSKFALTEGQRRRLGKLKAGSDERRVYLYRLASDPAVLQSQKAAAQP